MKSWKLTIGIIFILLGCGNSLFAQRMALKTNALYWVNCTPNLAAEFIVTKRTTFDASAYYTLSATPFDIDVRGMAMEYRYWIAGRPFVRSFVGLAAAGTIYTVETSKKKQMGDAGQFGLVYGYVLPLSSHWNIEFESGFGIAFFRERRYDPAIYQPGLPYNVKGHRFLPTKVAISVGYTF